MVLFLSLFSISVSLSLSLRTRLLPSNGEERQGKWFPRQAFNLALISNLPSAHVSTFHLVALCFPQLSLSLSLSSSILLLSIYIYISLSFSFYMLIFIFSTYLSNLYYSFCEIFSSCFILMIVAQLLTSKNKILFIISNSQDQSFRLIYI